jgi:hypothetical protein
VHLPYCGLKNSDVVYCFPAPLTYSSHRDDLDFVVFSFAKLSRRTRRRSVIDLVASVCQGGRMLAAASEADFHTVSAPPEPRIAELTGRR